MQTLRKLDDLLGPLLYDAAKIMFWIFAFIVLFVCLGYQLQAASFRYQLDYGEAPLVDQAMRMAQGQNIYRTDLSEPPYTVSNYPPLYVALLAIGVKLFGPAATFTFGRIVSMLSMWIAAYCVAFILYRQTQNRFAALAAAAVLLAFPYTVTWSALLRIDSLALALSLGGLALLVARPASTPHLIAAAMLLVAAIFTRQSYALAAPLAAFVWLSTQDVRKGIYLAGWVAGTSLVLFLLLNALTGGGFYFNIVTANVNEFKMDNLRYHWNRFREIGLILLIVGGVSLVVIRRWNPLWLLTTPYLLASLVSAVTIGKIGSNVNYLLELCVALSLASGVVIAASEKHLPVRSAGALIVIGLAFGIGRMIHFTLQDYTADLVERRASLSALSELSTLVAETEGQVLADEYMGMLTLHGRPLIIQPFEVTQLAWADKWDQTALLESIRNKEYSAILIYDKPWASERWTQEMFDAIDSSYVLTDRIAGNKVYTVVDLERRPSTDVTSCPGAVWQMPSAATLGVKLEDNGLDLFGQGNEGQIPVYAPGDGYLTRLPERIDAVVIEYDDPLQSGKKVWTLYEGMASADGRRSFIAQEFPAGTADAPVKAGQLVGYQGTWSGTPNWPMWTHVHVAILNASGLATSIDDATFLDPAQYLGLEIDPANQNLQPLRCKP